jgi:hypothetical protein
MSGQRHPDPETLATLRAGLAGGLRGRRITAHVARCARCAATSDDLAAVSSLLAATPTPPLPESFEQRISAALAAERAHVASSTEGTAADPAALGLGRAGADPGIAGEHARARVPVERPKAAPSRRRGPALRFRPAMAFVPLVLFVLAGFGYLLSTIGGQSNSSSNAEGFSAASSSASAPAAGPQAAAGRTATFVVTASGLNYLPSTLSSQVRVELAAQDSSSSGQQAIAPSASAATSLPHTFAGGASGTSEASGEAAATLPSGLAAPSLALSGCVLRVTGGVQPSLVDKATYEGRPAYVIAVSARAWVVERGCTASHPSIITTVALTAAR